MRKQKRRAAARADQDRLEAETASITELLQTKNQKSVVKLNYTRARTLCSELMDEGGDNNLIREANAAAKEAFDQYMACLIALQQTYTDACNEAGHTQTTEELDQAEKDFDALSKRYCECAVEERSNKSSETRMSRGQGGSGTVGRERKEIFPAPSESTHSSEHRRRELEQAQDDLEDLYQKRRSEINKELKAIELEELPTMKTVESRQHREVLGADMWRQLKRISIPMFAADK